MKRRFSRPRDRGGGPRLRPPGESLHAENAGAGRRAAELSPHVITPAEHRREGAPRLRVTIHDATGVAQVRSRVRDLVGIDMTPRRRADALLAVTELLANSLLHAAAGPVTVWGWLDAHRRSG